MNLINNIRWIRKYERVIHTKVTKKLMIEALMDLPSFLIIKITNRNTNTIRDRYGYKNNITTNSFNGLGKYALYKLLVDGSVITSTHEYTIYKANGIETNMDKVVDVVRPHMYLLSSIPQHLTYINNNSIFMRKNVLRGSYSLDKKYVSSPFPYNMRLYNKTDVRGKINMINNGRVTLDMVSSKYIGRVDFKDIDLSTIAIESGDGRLSPIVDTMKKEFIRIHKAVGIEA